jgi:hypothetical protein
MRMQASVVVDGLIGAVSYDSKSSCCGLLLRHLCLGYCTSLDASPKVLLDVKITLLILVFLSKE